MGFDIIVSKNLNFEDISKPNGKWTESKYKFLLELYNYIKITYNIKWEIQSRT